ncbi:MAG: N-acetylglucosamine-6-phosphate deacetylase [Chitinophagaceae bacterium]
MLVAYHHGILFTGEEVLLDQALLVKDGFIQGFSQSSDIPDGYQRVDLEGGLVAPALIDLQIYGGMGHLFSLYPSVEALQGIYRYCLGGGAGYFQATVATHSTEMMLAAIEAVRSYQQQGLAGLIGLHLEGPYIHPQKRGAHLTQYIQIPTRADIELLLEKGKGIITMMTLAPERCDPELIRLLLDHGVVVSAGHSNASYQEATQAFDQGIQTGTHLFNAMSAFQSREPGLVGAIFDHPGVNCSVVADGIHVDFAAIRIAKKIMGERLFLITDTVEVNKEGDYIYIREKDRFVTQHGTLAGSLLTMMSAVRNMVERVGIPLEEALRMASSYPAQVAGKGNSLGKLKPGYRADLVVFDSDYRVSRTIIS